MRFFWLLWRIGPINALALWGAWDVFGTLFHGFTSFLMTVVIVIVANAFLFLRKVGKWFSTHVRQPGLSSLRRQ